MIEQLERQRLEDYIAEIIDPEAYVSQTWDNDKQYEAIKKAGEIVRYLEEEMPSMIREVMVRQLRDSNLVIIDPEDDGTNLGDYIHDYDFEDF